MRGGPLCSPLSLSERGDCPPPLHLSPPGTGAQAAGGWSHGAGSRRLKVSPLSFLVEFLGDSACLLHHPEPLFPHLQNRTESSALPFSRAGSETRWNNECGNAL